MTNHISRVRWLFIICPLALPALAAAQSVPAGRWNVTSAIVELAVPGVPAFLQRMARGRATSERMVLSAGQGMEALLAPDPKARCTVDSQQVADGHYTQSLTCPQKHGEPLHIARSATYDAAGLAGRATVTGATPQGVLRIVLDQHTAHLGG